MKPDQDPSAEAVLDARAEADTAADAADADAADARADAGTEAGAEAGAGADTSTEAVADADAEADPETGTEAVADADAEAGPETGTEAVADANISFMFIASGNRSVITTYYDMFDPEDMESNNPAGRFVRNCGLYEASTDRLERMVEQAEVTGAAFDGVKIFRDEERVDGIKQILDDLRSSSLGATHVVCVAVLSKARQAMVAVFKKVRDEALAQGILPFPMYITQRVDQAHFLLDGLIERKVARRGTFHSPVVADRTSTRDQHTEIEGAEVTPPQWTLGRAARSMLRPEITRMLLLIYVPILIPITLVMIFCGRWMDQWLGLPLLPGSPVNYILFGLFFTAGATLWAWCYSYIVLIGGGGPAPLVAKGASRLVTDGPYGLTRHPSVVAKLVGVLAVGLLFRSTFFVCVILPLLLVGSLVEKKYFMEKRDLDYWGPVYGEYMERIPFFIPRWQDIHRLIRGGIRGGSGPPT